jgi:hypothetical protein
LPTRGGPLTLAAGLRPRGEEHLGGISGAGPVDVCRHLGGVGGPEDAPRPIDQACGSMREHEEPAGLHLELVLHDAVSWDTRARKGRRQGARRSTHGTSCVMSTLPCWRVLTATPPERGSHRSRRRSAVSDQASWCSSPPTVRGRARRLHDMGRGSEGALIGEHLQEPVRARHWSWWAWLGINSRLVQDRP